jgi:ArsR family transcriptional regulator
MAKFKMNEYSYHGDSLSSLENCMPFTRKTAGPSCAVKLKTLADPTRLEVIRILLPGPKAVGQINALLRIEQSLLSHHLKILRDAGLVTAARKGRGVQYRLLTPASGANAIELGCCRLSFESVRRSKSTTS